MFQKTRNYIDVKLFFFWISVMTSCSVFLIYENFLFFRGFCSEILIFFVALKQLVLEKFQRSLKFLVFKKCGELQVLHILSFVTSNWNVLKNMKSFITLHFDVWSLMFCCLLVSYCWRSHSKQLALKNDTIDFFEFIGALLIAITDLTCVFLQIFDIGIYHLFFVDLWHILNTDWSQWISTENWKKNFSEFIW